MDGSASYNAAPELQSAVRKLESDVQESVKEYIEAMERTKLREGIRIAMSISSLGNKFFQVTRRSYSSLCSYASISCHPHSTQGVLASLQLVQDRSLLPTALLASCMLCQRPLAVREAVYKCRNTSPGC